MGGVLVEFCRVGTIQTDDIACKLDRRTLHPQTDPQKRDPFLACKTHRFDLAFNTAFPKSTGDEDPVEPGQ